MADLNRARELYQPGTDLFEDMNYVSATYTLAEGLFELKKSNEALAVLSQAIEKLPTSGLAYSYRGMFFQYKIKDMRKAIADYEKAGEVDVTSRESSLLSIRLIDKLESIRVEDNRRKRRLIGGIVLGAVNTVVQSVTQPKSPPVQQTPTSNTPSRPQTTQSGNTNSSSSSNGSNSGTTSRNDPDFPSAMKGTLYTSQSAPSSQCVSDSFGTKVQKCWGDWTTDGNYSQIQYSGLGPIQSATNAVNDTPNVKSQAWYIKLKNTSNSIVELKLDVIYGDGKKTWVYFSIPPGETVYKSDFYTLSPAATVGIGVARLRSCSNFTRVQGGYRCEE